MSSLNIYSSMTADETDEDHMIWLKASEPAMCYLIVFQLPFPALKCT